MKVKNSKLTIVVTVVAVLLAAMGCWWLALWATGFENIVPGATQEGQDGPKSTEVDKTSLEYWNERRPYRKTPPVQVDLTPWVGDWLFMANGYEPATITVVPNEDGELIGTGDGWLLIMRPQKTGLYCTAIIANGSNAWAGSIMLAWPEMAMANGNVGALVVELRRPLEINYDYFVDELF